MSDFLRDVFAFWPLSVTCFLIFWAICAVGRNSEEDL